MRFGQNLLNITIPQWKECYINYQALKIFVTIISQIVQVLKDVDKLRKDIVKKTNDHSVNDLIVHPLTIQLDLIAEYLTNLMNETNQLFYFNYQLQQEITDLFYQMKILQIEQRYEICERMHIKGISSQNLPLYLTYIEYAFIEAMYVKEMREANLEAERKILKKHRKYAKQLIQTPVPCHETINRMARIEEQYIDKIENLYVLECKDMKSKQAREFLRNTTNREESNQANFDFFFSGLWIGSSISLLSTLIFIILYANLSVQNNSVFSRDFPTWRGIGIFILYIWILGGNLHFYQKYKISHRLIFKFEDHHFSKSTTLFRLAGLFTTVFFVLFLVYLLFITNIIPNNTSFKSQYLASLVWGTLVIYVFLPLPMFNMQGRFYSLKLIFKSIISPILGVEFSIIWMTDQWISLSTPLRDLAYTVCYYTKLDFEKIDTNPCKNNSTFEVIALPIVIALSFRILQCIRIGIQQGEYFKTRHFLNTLKYFASLSSSIISFFYNLGNSYLLYIWIATSATSTIFSYIWDLKYDWDLLQSNSKNKFLRKYLTFQPKRNYYIVIILNLVMRLSWMLTISPNIAKSFGNSALLTFVTGCIEIIRRGIWNLLRVQKQHLNNVKQFKAIPDTKDIEKKLLQKSELDLIFEALANVFHYDHQRIKREFIELINKKIKQRETNEEVFDKDYQNKHILDIKAKSKQLEPIKKTLKKII